MNKKAIFLIMFFLLIGYLSVNTQERNYSKRFDTERVKAELKDDGCGPFLWKLERVLARERFNYQADSGPYVPFICYYSWYRFNDDVSKMGTVSIHSPYCSADISLARAHIQEIEQYLGPQTVISVEWDGPGKIIEQQFFKGFLTAKEQLRSPLRWFVLYELAYYAQRGYIYNESKQIDFADPINQMIFWKDMAYFREKFFSRTDYFKIDGKPVLFFWTGAVKNLMYARAIAPEIFLIVGEALFAAPNFNSAGNSGLEERMLAVGSGGGGAVTSYCAYNAEEVKKHGRLNEGYITDMILSELKWLGYLRNNAPSVQYIPPITFTYDDTRVPDRQDLSGNPLNPPMFSDEISRHLLMRATLLLINEYNLSPLIRICSYNELGEGTALETSRNYGDALLRVVRDYTNRR